MALFGAALAVSTIVAAPAAAAELVVRDFVLAHGIVGREPTNETASFTTHDKKAFAFARINNTGGSTAVNIVWRHEGKQHGSVWLNVGDSTGWRTWSSANLKPGNWNVALIDAGGSVLVQRSFIVSQTDDTMAGYEDFIVEEPTSTSAADTMGGYEDFIVEERTSTSTVNTVQNDWVF
jgi:hypothetical protein